MRGLIWLNAVACVVYLLFTGGFVLADFWIFPKLGSFTPPPPEVGIAIEQATDVGGLRDVARVLLDHVTEQARDVNVLIRSGVFWGRLHFLAALGLACINVAGLLRLQRSNRAASGGKC